MNLNKGVIEMTTRLSAWQRGFNDARGAVPSRSAKIQTARGHRAQYVVGYLAGLKHIRENLAR